MRYDIRLQIDYRYPAASDHVRNLLRLMPSDSDRQRVFRRLLHIDPPPDERMEGRDFFGNATTLVVWHRPVAQIGYRLEARAERLAEGIAQAELDLSPSLDSLPAEIGAARGEAAEAGGSAGVHPGAPLHFRGPTPRISAAALSGAIGDFARAAVPRGVTARKAVVMLGQAVRDRIAFDAGATDAATPPEVAFAAGRGVCQDMAQIMIAGLRALGVPAGYVSGFLRTEPPPGQPRLEGVDAMHGWVMAWIGAQAGWVEYDPTNTRWAGADYITVARGRDYADAAPLRGALRTAGAQSTTHAVDVIALDRRKGRSG